MTDEHRDVSDEFAAQMKRFRPWAILFLVLIVMALVTPIVLSILGVEGGHFVWAAAAILIVLIPLAVMAIRSSTCPACRKFMGRDIGKFCPLCGARLRKDGEENQGAA